MKSYLLNFLRQPMSLLWRVKLKMFNEVIIKGGAKVSFKAQFERNVKIGAHSRFSGRIGTCSYLGDGTDLLHTRVGRFCSIAPNVRLIAGQHPSKDWVSSSPVFFSNKGQLPWSFTQAEKFEEYSFVEGGRFWLEVGHDVWIGEGAAFFNGVRVGNGAIVGARSLVTSDLKPYGVYVGTPAKLIRMRFSEDEISWLEKITWWEWDISVIRRAAPYFDNIETLKEFVSKEGLNA